MRRVLAFLAAPVAGVWILAAPAAADYYLDVQGQAVPPFSDINWVFPNWEEVPAAAFVIRVGDDTTYSWCPVSQLVGITIYNYGTATGSAPGAGGDVDGMYFHMKCGDTDSGMRTMTYAGDWTVGAMTYPAWTWAGAIPWASALADPAEGLKGCGS